MSRAVLTAILSEMQVWLSDFEAEMLYRELLAYFGLIGAVNECQAMEEAWRDPYNRNKIEEFIGAWLRKRHKRKEEVIAEVVNNEFRVYNLHCSINSLPFPIPVHFYSNDFHILQMA